MRSTITSVCNFVIEYTYYAIFLTVPFAFTDKTFELFEFNKMWLLFGYTIIIATAWFSKMIAQKRFYVQKTPLDIPIGLFLLSQIISTLFSMDPHLSWWGYYSRFNGGLFSMLSYILLYYAFVSTIAIQKHEEEEEPQHIHAKHPSPIVYIPNALTMVKRSLMVSVIAVTLVGLWGFPSHFGYDPTCLIFRGSLDTSCWTADFHPTVRIFSTLGQPNWLAMYLALLLLLPLAFVIHKLEQYGSDITKHTKQLALVITYIGITALLFIDIIYTDSQSGYLGIAAGIGIFTLCYFLLSQKTEYAKTSLKYILVFLAVFGLFTFLIGIPVVQLKKFTLPELQRNVAQTPTTPQPEQKAAEQPKGPALEGGGGTDSGTIRKYVWQGALDIWKANPLFGTGVETYAFAYYKYRPAGHNMTSEWDYLYNKAHNEYLNYLATTGAFGLLSYLSFIGMFLFLSFRMILQKQLSRFHALLISALIGGYVSMLISNFFGFSVVLGNMYLFLFPAFVFVLAQALQPSKSIFFSNKAADMPSKHSEEVTATQWSGIVVLMCIGLFQLYVLTMYWIADTEYALANNLDRVGEYNQGYQHIKNAVAMRGDEPVFKEELANNYATLAVALVAQKQNDQAIQLASEAIQTINQITTEYPNNLNFLKSQVRVYYSLAQVNPAYLAQALEAMKKAQLLAPTDAKIAYNAGVLYGQTGDTKKGIEVLQQTLKLKPDYQEVYYALGLFYRDLAVDKNGTVINPEMQGKAVEQMQFIINNYSNNKPAVDALKSWGVPGK